MIAAPGRQTYGNLDLAGRALSIPSLQPEPLPISQISPSPCTEACPAGINVKAYVSLIAEGRFDQALQIVRQSCPLPGVCGRVCPAPCEEVCRRSEVDDPVAIRALKRFVADYGLENPSSLMSPIEVRPDRVAVIGAGPAGLTAAYDLRRSGYQVDVLEAESEPGGMLRYGIAAYRLPREILNSEIEALSASGINIRTGVRLGTDLSLEELLKSGYSAVLLAVGAQVGRRLGVPGESGCAAVEDALTFLRRVNEGGREPVRGRVIVIGGGSTAVEAARSALRLGADSVEIIYRRYREELLAGKEEIEAAQAEGIRFRFLVAPLEILNGKGQLRALQCIKVGLGEPDKSGRRGPILVPGTEFEIEADRVLTAVSQQADLDFIPQPFLPRLAESGWLQVDSTNSMTNLRGVFAAGDVVSRPATVIEAIADGHRAAASIGSFLKNGSLEQKSTVVADDRFAEFELQGPVAATMSRRHPVCEPFTAGSEFDEVERCYSADSAMSEAGRCLRCGPCSECLACTPSCARRHLLMDVGESPDRSVLLRTSGAVASHLDQEDPPTARLLPSARPLSRLESEIGDGEPVALFPVRVAVLAERCRGCSRCIEVCPFDAIRASEAGAVAEVDAARCRGCSLCTAVCPTDAMVNLAFSPRWWAQRVAKVNEAALAQPTYAVLACERRTEELEAVGAFTNGNFEIVRFRCVGQLDAGMILQLSRTHPRGVLLAGCLGEHCRYGAGARLARVQLEIAQSMLHHYNSGFPPLTSDWSGSRSGDSLKSPIARMAEEFQASSSGPTAGGERH